MPKPRKYPDKKCPFCDRLFYAKPQVRVYCSRECYFAHKRALYAARTPDGTKHCKKCDHTKDYADFYANPQTSDGRSAYCKKCMDAYNKEHAHKYRPQAELYAHNWYMQKNYGITREEYFAEVDRVGGLCEICRSKPNERRLSVDHCHQTGRVRGLLCSRCNSAIAYSDDDPERLRRMAEYLERPSKWQLT